MTIHELRAHPHLSASSVTGYIECGLQYKFGKVDRIPPEHTSDSLVFGSAIHKTIERFQSELMMGTMLSHEDLITSFEKIWIDMTADRIDITYKEGKDASTLLQEGRNILTIYYDNHCASSATILAIEEPFSCYIPGIPVPIIGVIDLVEEEDNGTIVISDVKTTGRTFSDKEIDNNFQLTVYHYAMKANGYHDRDIKLRFDMLVKTAKPKFKQAYTTRSDDDVKRMCRTVRTVWDGIQKGVFIPNPTSWKCSGCQYAEHCREWFVH